MFMRKLKNRSVILISSMYSCILSKCYRFKNQKKPKMFIYTDSRGYEITKLWNKRNPFSSYVGELIKKYNVEYHICEQDSTTIIDFLYTYKKNILEGKKYDIVIAHVGLVDFSPRPYSMVKKIIADKFEKIKFLKFDDNCIRQHIEKPISSEIYNGERLANLYPKDYFKREIIPMISSIEGIIYIGCNPLLSDWRGNYWQDRPKDINLIMEYNELVLNSEISKRTISISDWNREDIINYTVDNIHLSPLGFKKIKNNIDDLLIKSDKP